MGSADNAAAVDSGSGPFYLPLALDKPIISDNGVFNVTIVVVTAPVGGAYMEVVMRATLLRMLIDEAIKQLWKGQEGSKGSWLRTTFKQTTLCRDN